MNVLSAKTLRKLREEKGLLQKQLGQQFFVNHSTVARWENASRLPDPAMVIRLADCLGADAGTLFQLASQSDESSNVIIVDESRLILSDGLSVLEEILPSPSITGFVRPQETLECTRKNQIVLDILDIEPKTASGLDLCREPFEIMLRGNMTIISDVSGTAVTVTVPDNPGSQPLPPPPS